MERLFFFRGEACGSKVGFYSNLFAVSFIKHFIMDIRKMIILPVILVILSVFATAFTPKDDHAKSPCMVWKKIVSREIEIPEKVDSSNHQKGKVNNNITLAKMMVNAIKDSKVTGYSNYDMSLSTKLSAYEYDDILGNRVDTQEITDPITGQVIRKFVHHAYDYAAFVHTYRILEQWTFDPLLCKTEIQILGIAAVRDVYGDDGSFRGVQAVFWLHYEEARPILDKYDRSHPGHTVGQFVWNDFFNAESKPAVKGNVLQGKASRVIDLPAEREDTIKHHLRSEQSDDGLINSLIGAKYAGNIIAYSRYGQKFTDSLPARTFIDPGMFKVDTQVITDPITNQEFTAVINTQINNHKVHHPKVNIIESWSFNPVKGKTEIDIEGMAPLEEGIDDKNNLGFFPLFWVQYKDVREVINQYAAQHPKNTFANCLWDNYFLSDTRPTLLE